MYNQQRVLDILMRHQLYMECVKTHKHKQFDAVLFQLRETLDDLFKGIRVKSMNELTRYALRTLLYNLRAKQADIYATYTEDAVDYLKQFMAADLLTSKVIFSTIERPEGKDVTPVSEADATGDLLDAYDENKRKKHFVPFLFLTGSADGNDKLWSRISNTPIPANGIEPLTFIDGFTESASNSIENIIRKGYANASAPADVLDEIIGTASNNYRDGQLTKIYIQEGALTATLLQFVSSMVQSSVASAYISRYMLAAVIDGRTTAICLSLNGRVYDYGNGPLPPFHINCRTKAVPYVDDNSDAKKIADESYKNWIKRQPEAFRDDWSDLELQKGIDKFSGASALSIEQFSNKVDLMLID